MVKITQNCYRSDLLRAKRGFLGQDFELIGLEGVSAQQLSDVIGAVYDCAIDPELWPAACKTIAGLSASTAGGICVHDLKHRTSVVRRSVLFCTCLARPVGLVADQPALPE